ncbi:protein jag [Patescibacteria group bacterium]
MQKTKTLDKVVNELLNLMGTKAKAKVSEDKTNEALVVDIQTEDEKGLLIGHRGETLAGLQMVLGMILRKETGEWSRVLVNVGDYKEKEEAYLNGLATSAAKRAIETKEPQNLYNLTSAQRRIIHMTLSTDKEIVTESQGEGKERYLVIKPNKA